MSFYSDMVATALALLTKYGQTITHERDESTLWQKTIDPTTLKPVWTNTSTGATSTTAPTGVPVQTTGKGVLTNIKINQNDFKTVEAKDQILIANGAIPEPQIGDEFTVNSVRWGYKDHIKISPAGTDIVYKILVRI